MGTGNARVVANERVTNEDPQEPRGLPSRLEEKAAPLQNGGGVFETRHGMRSPPGGVRDATRRDGGLLRGAGVCVRVEE